MRWRCTDFLGATDRTNKSFMNYKRMPAYNVGVLVVTFFGLRGDLKTAACMCSLSEQRTFHLSPSFYLILRTIHSISKPSISHQTQCWLLNHCQRWAYGWAWRSFTLLHLWAIESRSPWLEFPYRDQPVPQRVAWRRCNPALQAFPLHLCRSLCIAAICISSVEYQYVSSVPTE